MNASGSAEAAGERARNGVHRFAKDAKHGAERVKRTAAGELSNLVDDVEDLVRRIADVADVDVATLRERLSDKVTTARETLAAGGQHVTQVARDAAKSTDEFVRGSPWQAIGLAALAGAVLGVIVARR